MDMNINTFKAWASEALSKTNFSEQEKAEILNESNSIFELADQESTDGTKGADGNLNKNEAENAKAFFNLALEFIEKFSKKDENSLQKNPFDEFNGYYVQKHSSDINKATILVNGESVGVVKNEDDSYTILRGHGGWTASEVELTSFKNIDELKQALEDPKMKFGKYSGFNINDYNGI